MKTIKVKLTFTEPLLGTWPASTSHPRAPTLPPSRMRWPPWAQMPQPIGQ